MRKGFDVTTWPSAAFGRSTKLLGILSVSAPLILTLAGPVHAVDGVIEINQARALAGSVTPGDLPGFPVTISQPGSYRLTGNLVLTSLTGPVCGPTRFGGSSVCVIDVESGNVSLDLNGFEIVSGVGAVFAGDEPNTTVMNGTIRSGGQLAVQVGAGSRLERLQVLTFLSGVPVISALDACIIRDNVIGSSQATPSAAIEVDGDGCTITGNTISAVSVSISVQGRATITDNTVSGGVGIACSDACTITNNTSTRIIAGDGSSIINNSVRRAILRGIACSGACTITSNTVTNPFPGFEDTAIEAEDGSLVLSNTVRGYDVGLDLGNFVGYAGNVLTENTTTVSGGIEIGTNLCGTNTICP